MKKETYKNKNYNRIKELRIANGDGSIREFVKMLNDRYGYKVSIATISIIENHRHENPSWELVDVLAKHFNVTTDYLMGRTNYNVRLKDVDKIKTKHSPEEEMMMQQFYERMKKMNVERKRANEERRRRRGA